MKKMQCDICTSRIETRPVEISMPGLRVLYHVCSDACEEEAQQRGKNAWQEWLKRQQEGNDVMVQAIFRSNDLHTLMDVVDKEIQRLTPDEALADYVFYLRELKGRVMAAWASVLPGQEGVLVVREEETFDVI